MRLTVPWAAPGTAPRTEVVVQASPLTLTRTRDVPGFLLAALRIRRAARHTPGFAGLGLIADLGTRTFFTLSAWDSPASLGAFVTHPVHRRAQQRFGPRMAGSHVATWTRADTADPAEYPPRWHDALARLARLRQHPPTKPPPLSRLPARK